MSSPMYGPLLLAHNITATSVSEESREQITFGCQQVDCRMAIISEFFLKSRVYTQCWSYTISFVTVNALDIAICPRGIVDMKFINNSGATMTWEKYAEISGVTFGRLLPKGDDKISGIIAEVDVPSLVFLL